MGGIRAVGGGRWAVGGGRWRWAVAVGGGGGRWRVRLQRRELLLHFSAQLVRRAGDIVAEQLANLSGDMGRYGEIWGDMGRYGVADLSGELREL